MHDWLRSWPALALACGLPLDKDGQPLIVSPSQHCKRRHEAFAPVHESLFVLVVVQALRRRLIGARDLIIDSAPILAWRRRDPDAAYGHAPAHHPHSSYKVAKKVVEFDYQEEIPRSRLRAAYGDGFKGAPLRCQLSGEGHFPQDALACDGKATQSSPLKDKSTGGSRHV